MPKTKRNTKRSKTRGKKNSKPRVTRSKNNKSFTDKDLVYNPEEESEDIIEFLNPAVVTTQYLDDDGELTDDASTDDEHVEVMVKELEPKVYSMYNESDPRPSIKKIFDYKIVSPYLLSAFVNGYLDTEKCAHLKDRKSRRKLFYYFN